MKIALCLSGFLRNFDKTFSFWKKYLFDIYNVDIFIDTWNTIDYNSDVASQDVLSAFQKNIKNINIEKRIINFNKNIMLSHFRQATNGNINNPISMFYKIKSCYLLCKQSSVNYDIIIRARPDLFIISPFIFEEDYNQYIYVPTHDFHNDFDKIGRVEYKDYLLKKYVDFQKDELQGNGLIKEQGLLDHLAYSSVNNMEAYSGVYDNYEKYYQEGCNVRPEIILAYHLLNNNIKTKSFLCNFRINL
jgi:hypothetical protein